MYNAHVSEVPETTGKHSKPTARNSAILESTDSLVVRSRTTSLNFWNGDRRCVRSSVPRGDSLVVDGYFWNSLRYAS
jgi:hypothetical protein